MNSVRNSRYLVMSALGVFSLIATVASSGQYRSTQATPAGSDVSVSIVADRNTVKAGQSVTYTVTMTNLGPDDATFTDVVFALPDGLQVVSITCDLGISSDGPFCEYGSLPAGASLVSTLMATPQTGTPTRSRTVIESATILFENADAFDPDTSNNAASVRTKLIGRLRNP